MLRVELNAAGTTTTHNHIYTQTRRLANKNTPLILPVSLTTIPEQRLRVVHDSLVGVIVGVGEEDVPVLW